MAEFASFCSVSTMPLKLEPPNPPRTKYWYVRGTYLGQYIDRSTRTTKRAVAIQCLKKLERDIEAGELTQAPGPTFASAALAYMQAGGERRFLRPLCPEIVIT